MKRFCQLIMVAFILSIPVTATNDTAYAIHKAAFDKVLSAAEHDPYAKYGIYSSRIIAVKHPELYLQGDLLFARWLITQPGLEKAFKEPANSFYFRMRPMGPPFSFQLVDIAKNKVVSKEELYGPDSPLFGLLDERISSIHTTLKVNRLTSLEQANLTYVMKRMADIHPDNIYLIFSKENIAFLSVNGGFFDCRGNLIDRKVIKNPVLIMNERNVWYPLMDRDDTSRNPKLKSLVDLLATSERIPLLSEDEMAFSKKLAILSSLSNDSQKNLATIYSIHYDGLGYYTQSYLSHIRELLTGSFSDTYELKTNMFLNIAIIKYGNYLSPITAYLSSLAKDTTQSLKNIESIYLTNVGTEKEFKNGKEFSAWGHTWLCTVIENNIDDAFRTRGGHCLSQAVNLSAVFDLANMDNIFINRLGDYQGEVSHAILLLPQFKRTYDNGVLQEQSYYKNQGQKDIEMGIVGDEMVIFSDTFILYNTTKEKAVKLHQRLEVESMNFWGWNLKTKYAESVNKPYDVYKMIQMP